MRIEPNTREHTMLGMMLAAEERNISMPHFIFSDSVTNRVSKVDLIDVQMETEGRISYATTMTLSKLGRKVLEALENGGFYDDLKKRFGDAVELNGLQGNDNLKKAKKLMNKLVNDPYWAYCDWGYASESVQTIVLSLDGGLAALKASVVGALKRADESIDEWKEALDDHADNVAGCKYLKEELADSKKAKAVLKAELARLKKMKV